MYRRPLLTVGLTDVAFISSSEHAYAFAHLSCSWQVSYSFCFLAATREQLSVIKHAKVLRADLRSALR